MRWFGSQCSLRPWSDPIDPVRHERVVRTGSPNRMVSSSTSVPQPLDERVGTARSIRVAPTGRLLIRRVRALLARSRVTVALSGDGGAIARSRKQVTRELDVLADTFELSATKIAEAARIAAGSALWNAPDTSIPATEACA